MLPKVSESLAGRMEVLSLAPFSQGEIAGRREGFVEACFARTFKPGVFRDAGWPALVERIVRGGFPEALARTDARAAGGVVWQLHRNDSRARRARLVERANLSDLPRLLRLLAARTSGVLNLSGVARDAHRPLTTLQRHWALLEAVFFVRTLPAWSGNLTSRLAKAPKVLLNDTGLLCHLLNLDADRLKTDELMSGSVLESFVAGELAKQAAWSRTSRAFSLSHAEAAGGGFGDGGRRGPVGGD